jgi:hypothetical protein
MHNFVGEGSEENLNNEKTENHGGVYKNADLLKMHAYKDAIRRTGGAYVLYPGDKKINKKGFHEIIPGLGAFPMKPSKSESGVSDLKVFILSVIDHFINRASQREKVAFRTYDIYKNKPKPENELKELLPEPYRNNRYLLPDETFVLVGYFKSQEQYDWIKKKGLYNFRMGTGHGSLELDRKTVAAKYLLLHTAKDSSSGELWKIESRGPRVFSKSDLEKLKYKSPSQESYLVIEVKRVQDQEFEGIR